MKRCELGVTVDKEMGEHKILGFFERLSQMHTLHKYRFSHIYKEDCLLVLAKTFFRLSSSPLSHSTF
ncbi:hypothetical protein O9993_10315 [Vibrio lentus]|nr:hypothetical protein [Vibrio lentus]